MANTQKFHNLSSSPPLPHSKVVPVLGTLVDVSQNLWKLVDVFSQKRVFYRNFRDVSTRVRGFHLHTRGKKIGVFLHVFGAEYAFFCVARNFTIKVSSQTQIFEPFQAIFYVANQLWLQEGVITYLWGSGPPTRKSLHSKCAYMELFLFYC